MSVSGAVEPTIGPATGAGAVRAAGWRSRSAPPRANAFAERWVGTARRELLDRTLVFGSGHLHRLLAAYVEHYNSHRPHWSLDQQPPDPSPPRAGTPTITAVRRRRAVGGLINESEQAA